MSRLADPGYEPQYAAVTTPAASATANGPAGALRGLVDADVLPSGTNIVAGEGPEQRVAQVLADGRLYADGEAYDGLVEMSEALGIVGNPWSLWAAELADGRVILGVLSESADEGERLRRYAAPPEIA